MSSSQPCTGDGFTCHHCQRPFDTERGLRTHLGMVHDEKIADRICAQCKEPFRGRPRRKYCSPACDGQSRRNQVRVECGSCYKPFYVRKSRCDRYGSHYCGERCRGIVDRVHFGEGGKLRRFTRPGTFKELVRHAYFYEGQSFGATCRIVNAELDDDFSREVVEGMIAELRTHERNVRNRVWALRPEDLGLSPIGKVADQ